MAWHKKSDDYSTSCWESECGTGKWCLNLDFERLIQVCEVDGCKDIKMIEHGGIICKHLCSDSWQNV